MNKNEKNELLEWYNNLNIGSVRPTPYPTRQDIEPPTTSDLSTVPPDSPQDDIQKEILSRQSQSQMTMKSDPMVAQDKTNAYKAYALVEVIKHLLSKYSDLSGADSENMLEKESVTSEIKRLANELNDQVAKL